MKVEHKAFMNATVSTIIMSIFKRLKFILDSIHASFNYLKMRR